MKITFTKKSVKALNKWLKKNGFATECVYAKNGELEYDPDEDLITIPRRYVSEPDTYFIKCFRALGFTADFDTVTLSILHELGHAQTFHLFTAKEWCACHAKKSILALEADPDDENYYFAYWNVPDELAANNWAVLYTKSFPKKVERLENIIEEFVKFG